MAIPDYEKLMYPVLKLLGDDKEYSGIELSNIIADKLKLTEQILLQSKKWWRYIWTELIYFIEKIRG